MLTLWIINALQARKLAKFEGLSAAADYCTGRGLFPGNSVVIAQNIVEKGAHARHLCLMLYLPPHPILMLHIFLTKICG